MRQDRKKSGKNSDLWNAGAPILPPASPPLGMIKEKTVYGRKTPTMGVEVNENMDWLEPDHSKMEEKLTRDQPQSSCDEN